VALAEGEVGEATARATNVLAYLEAQSLAGCEAPGAVVLTCYQALQATRERRAVEALRLGSVIIEQRVAVLLPEDRERYLDVFPARRQVLIAWRDLQSAEKRRRVPISLFPLPSAAASTECVASCGA